MNCGITSNIDLKKMAKKMNINVDAIIYKDEINKYDSKKDGSYIIDLHDQNDSSIGHWVSLYKKGSKCIYFDSFGIVPPITIIEFCKPYNIEHNNKELQSFNSGWCGSYCLMFLYNIQRGRTLNDIKNKFNQFN